LALAGGGCLRVVVGGGLIERKDLVGEGGEDFVGGLAERFAAMPLRLPRDARGLDRNRVRQSGH